MKIKTKLIQLSIGEPKIYKWKEQTEHSGIGKTKVNEVYLSRSGFLNDGVANLKAHGGPDRAVCLYPYEHYQLWENEFGKRLIPPAFGENITATGMVEKDIYIGDVFRLGDALIEVSQGRVPCSTISKYNHIDALLKRVVETGFTGYFFRVLEEGMISSKSKLSLEYRVQNKLSVFKGHQLLFHEQENKKEISEYLQLKALSSEWTKRFQKLIEDNR